MTTYTLTGITKRVRYIYYHVAYTFADGRVRYTEMRREKICKDKLYLQCVNKKDCKVFLSISIKNPIKTVKTGQQSFDFMPDVTVEMLMNPENYGEFSHRHLSRCISTIDSDKLCSKTKHNPKCYKKTDQKFMVRLAVSKFNSRVRGSRVIVYHHQGNHQRLLFL